MEEWLGCFGKDNFVLILNGQKYRKSDCFSIARGTEKRIFGLANTGLCFFIPGKYSDEANWNQLIATEKRVLDYIIALGIEAQRFEIVPLTIQNENGESYTIPVLLTQSFDKVAEERNLIIYNPKCGTNGTQVVPTVFGKTMPFYPLKDKLKDPVFAKRLMSKLVSEYAIALTFLLPIHATTFMLDDSVHYCFELSTDLNEPPIIRYMFWDVPNTVAKIPFVPTLAQLKNYGLRLSAKNISYTSIESLALDIASAIYSVAHEEVRKQMQEGDYLLTVMHQFIDEIKGSLIPILHSDDFLEDALAEARKGAIIFLLKIMAAPEFKNEIAENPAQFLKLMLSAISTADLHIVKEALELYSDYSTLSLDSIQVMVDTATQYGNVAVLEYLTGFQMVQIDQYKQKEEAAQKQREEDLRKEEENRNQSKENLKAQFMSAYNGRLKKEQEMAFGFGRFFYKNDYVHEGMSLEQLIAHARGEGVPGSKGDRSRSVMIDLGWLNQNNALRADLKELCESRGASAYAYS